MTKTKILGFGVALGALFIAAPAFADALPPAAEDCAGGGGGGTVAVGGACSLHDTASTAGTCQNSTCNSVKYCSDGGINFPCGSTTHDCILCVSGSASSGDGGAATSDGGTTGKSSSSGGCTVTGNDTSPWNILLPLGLAALVPLALRRKKNKA